MARMVWVDAERCIRCGLCVSLAPGVFRLEERTSVAWNPDGAPEVKIQECIDGCPVEAIHWR